LDELGIRLESEGEVNAAFARFKDLADKKSDIFDEDIMALVSDEAQSHDNEYYAYVSLAQHSETGEKPFAKVVFTIENKEVVCEGNGNGPVDAIVNAIESKVQSELNYYCSRSMRLPLAPNRKAKSPCASPKLGASSTALALILISWWHQPRRICRH